MFTALDRLNDQQRAAAGFTGQQLRILAGAGTGKTTTLTSRVAFLVESGVPAERIMLLTFTRRAAREMVSRTDTLLAGSIESKRRSRVLGGTFHSVAHRTLRRHAVALGLPEGFSTLDSSDAADVIDLVRQEQATTTVRGRRFPKKATLLDLYSRSVNTQQPLSSVIDQMAPWCVDHLEPIAAICRGYVARKRMLGLVDFDDLLLYWRAAAADERLGQVLAADIDHICVDEYQDVNALQVDVLQRSLRRTDPAPSRSSATIRRRCTGFVAQVRGTSSTSRRRSPAMATIAARAQLPVDPADPRRGQRGQRRRAGRIHDPAAIRARAQH